MFMKNNGVLHVCIIILSTVVCMCQGTTKLSLELHMSHFYMQYELGTLHVYMFVYVRVRVCECVYYNYMCK